MDGLGVLKAIAHNQGLSPTEKISKGHSLHKDPMTSKLLDPNEKLLPVADL